MFLGMRVKTSVTLPKELLERIDRMDANRSAFLERAGWLYVSHSEKAAKDAEDAAILDRCAARLNKEAADVLEYQGLPE